MKNIHIGLFTVFLMMFMDVYGRFAVVVLDDGRWKIESARVARLPGQ